MFKKIVATVLVGMAAVFSVAGPAQADYLLEHDSATCTYDNGTVNHVAAEADTYLRDDGRLGINLHVYNDGENRYWNWTVKHNGDTSASGTNQGGFTEYRTYVDFAGPDTFKINVDNRAKDAHCVINIYT